MNRSTHTHIHLRAHTVWRRWNVSDGFTKHTYASCSIVSLCEVGRARYQRPRCHKSLMPRRPHGKRQTRLVWGVWHIWEIIHPGKGWKKNRAGFLSFSFSQACRSHFHLRGLFLKWHHRWHKTHSACCHMTHKQFHSVVTNSAILVMTLAGIWRF